MAVADPDQLKLTKLDHLKSILMMKNIFSKLILSTALIAALAACSSGANKERQTEAIATHRATVLSNQLPIEHGPLSIMQAKAKGKVIEIMMIYNGTKALSAQALCFNKEISANLEHGVMYDIKIRNPRGQLLIDQLVSQKSCAKS